MKKLTIIALFLILPAFLFAQEYAVDKGSMLVGGSAGFMSLSGDLYEDADEEGSTQFWVSPSVLYFIMPGLGVGADLNFSKYSQGDYSETEMGIGPTVAYFIGDANSSMYPFVSATYLFGTETDKYDSQEMKHTETSIMFRGGVMFMVAKTTGIGIAGFYDMDSRKHEDADEATKGNAFGVSVHIASFIFK